MKTTTSKGFLIIGALVLWIAAFWFSLQLSSCRQVSEPENEIFAALRAKGLSPDLISTRDFYEGNAPALFREISGADYKPSYNPDPAISPQCWVETGYGTQNACKYCHTDYLVEIGHGNNWPSSQHQILYDFPGEQLNRILWRNIIFPHEIDERLKAEGVDVPSIDDVDYVRQDNWRAAFAKARSNGNSDWINPETSHAGLLLFPALNPDHLFPYDEADPTGNGTHGYVDPLGFVRDENEAYTGWRAVNFFPYPVFTPLTGSVSGIYIRLPSAFQTFDGAFDLITYIENLEILEKNIKNRDKVPPVYVGDAIEIEVRDGFYPVGTEFAHPLHYVDLKASGRSGDSPEGVVGNTGKDYEFPGTRSKRIKEMRYMYKWKEVNLADIGEEEEEEAHEEEFEEIIGREGQGWVENDMGWILAAYIENRSGDLRPQTTEELMQCVGCHSRIGNTIDAVWSFQRKLPGSHGWREMDYGSYDPQKPELTFMQDYVYGNGTFGELGEFYNTVVGADLYGVMPVEIRTELIRYASDLNLLKELELTFPIENIFDDESLKTMGKEARKARLVGRKKIMQHFAENKGYLNYHSDGDRHGHFIKGTIFYPSTSTMKENILLYRKIVLDQSFNLGKDVFGTEKEHVPFTFRSDGEVLDENRNLIPAGEVITSRPYNKGGVGVTKTGIEQFGTFDAKYNPILSDKPLEK
jgi:hypothetical protein